MPNYPPVLVGANGVPISSGYKPDDGWHALQLSRWVKTDLVGSLTSAPAVMQSVTQEWLMSGVMYVATTGLLKTATNPTLVMGASLFNPSTAKEFLITSARVMQSAQQNNIQLNLTTTDPALAQTGTPVNLQVGSVVASGASFTYPANNATASVATPGTVIDWAMTNAAAVVEFIPPNMGILLPAVANNGVAIYTTIGAAGGLYAITFRYVELNP